MAISIYVHDEKLSHVVEFESRRSSNSASVSFGQLFSVNLS